MPSLGISKLTHSAYSGLCILFWFTLYARSKDAIILRIRVFSDTFDIPIRRLGVVIMAYSPDFMRFPPGSALIRRALQAC